MPQPTAQRLTGLKVLVVEDSFLIAEHVCGILRRQGCEVLGPAPRVAAGLALVERGPPPDCAVLDVNLHGELCFPIAQALASRAIPFIFLTGYDERTIIPPDLAGARVLGKPMDDAFLVDAIALAVADGKPS